MHNPVSVISLLTFETLIRSPRKYDFIATVNIETLLFDI